MKKGQGLTLNTMAVAVIVLVVIVVVIAIFTGVIGNVAPSLTERTECNSQANSVGCIERDVCQGDGGVSLFGLGCPEKDGDSKYCCVKS